MSWANAPTTPSFTSTGRLTLSRALHRPTDEKAIDLTVAQHHSHGRLRPGRKLAGAGGGDERN